MTDPNAAPASTPANPPSDPNPAAGTPPTASADGTPPAASSAPAAAAAAAAPDTAQPAAPAADAGKDGWGADWRQQYAKGDEKTQKWLERFASPAAALDSLREAQRKISAGELAKPLAADATAEQVAAWRTANGIPEKPEGYLEKLPNGLVIGEDDKPVFAEIAQKLHGLNADPKVMHELASWYYDTLQASEAKLAETDAQVKAQTEEALRAEWGADYRVNLNAISGWLSTAPKDVQDMLHSARLPDGRALIGLPEVARWMVSQAREINPTLTLVPSGDGAPAISIDTEIAAIEKEMKENRSTYMKDERKQARYRELITARDKLRSRSAA